MTTWGPQAGVPSSSTAAPLAPYVSPKSREAALQPLARAGDGEIVDYGQSVEGRPLKALVLPGPHADCPRLLCSANIHGVEFIGSRVALAFAGALVDVDNPVSRLRSAAEVWIAPCLNPDGYARTWRAEGHGRLADLRTNANGVDLNRNFPLPGPRRFALPGTGSGRPGRATYRGSGALSEPETAAIDGLMGRCRFHASANLHSFMGTLIPARVTGGAAFAAYRRLGRAFRRGQSSYRYPTLSSRWFDVFTGEMEDHQHHAHDTWATCVEVFTVIGSLRQHLPAPSLFWRFNPRDPQAWVVDAIAGLSAYFLEALRLPPPSRLA